MKKQRLFGIILFFFLMLFLLRWLLSALWFPRITTENLSLQEKWVTSLSQDIQHLVVTSNNTILARTSSHLYALDIDTGKILWTYETGWLISNSPIFEANGNIFFTDNKSIWSIKLENGETAWHIPLYSPEYAKIIDISKDVIVIYDTQQIFAYAQSDRSLLWSQSVCRNSFQSYVHDRVLFFPCLGVNAVDIDSGTVIWKDTNINISGATAYVDDVLYFSQSYASIMAYDLQDKSILWQVPLLSKSGQTLSIEGNFLFSYDSNRFCALERLHPRVIWCADDIRNAQSPQVLSNTVYIPNGFGDSITAYELQSGKKVGQIVISQGNIIPSFVNAMIASNNLLVFSSANKIFAFTDISAVK